MDSLALSALCDPTTFAIKTGYTSNLKPEYFRDDCADGVTWQPSLYPLVANLARALACEQLVDIGCGQAGKLHGFSPEFDIVGLDYGANLELCRQRYPMSRWIDIDLERPSLPAEEWTRRRSGIVCGDVIEHLADPRPLLATVKMLLATSPFVALSTPERDLHRGADDTGPPLNRCHVREWSLREFVAFCTASGLDVAWSGLTTTRTGSSDCETSLVILVGPDTPEANKTIVRRLATSHV